MYLLRCAFIKTGAHLRKAIIQGFHTYQCAPKRAQTHSKGCIQAETFLKMRRDKNHWPQVYSPNKWSNMDFWGIILLLRRIQLSLSRRFSNFIPRAEKSTLEVRFFGSSGWSTHQLPGCICLRRKTVINWARRPAFPTLFPGSPMRGNLLSLSKCMSQ